MSKIVITVDLKEDTQEDQANELAEAILVGLAEFDDREYQGGDLRAFVKSYKHEITE